MTHISVNEEAVEFLKVWYSIFCTILDAHEQGDYTDAQMVQKVTGLRAELRKRLPSVEAELVNRERRER